MKDKDSKLLEEAYKQINEGVGINFKFIQGEGLFVDAIDLAHYLNNMKKQIPPTESNALALIQHIIESIIKAGEHYKRQI